MPVGHSHTQARRTSYGSIESQRSVDVESAPDEMDDANGSRRESFLKPMKLPAHREAPSDAMRFKWDQMEMRATVQDTYSICSALLTGFCVCSVYISKEQIVRDGHGDTIRYYALCTHQYLLRLTTAMGLYSTLIFMLSALYMRTSLAKPVWGLAVFQLFSDKTAKLRKSAFDSMYCAVLIFSFSLSLSLFYSLPDVVAGLMSISVLIILIFTAWHGQELKDAAGMLFMTDEDIESLLLEDHCKEKHVVDDDVLAAAERAYEEQQECDIVRRKTLHEGSYLFSPRVTSRIQQIVAVTPPAPILDPSARSASARVAHM